MLSGLEELKPITLNWADTQGLKGEQRLHADNINRWLEDRLPFALMPQTEIGRQNGDWSLYQTSETHQLFAINDRSEEVCEILADWYDSTEARKVRSWAPRKRDGDILRMTYRDIADEHAKRVVELTGIQCRASEIAWDYSDDRNALLTKLSDDEEGLPAEVVARAVISAAEGEITRCRNLYQRMQYNVIVEHAKQVDVAGDDMEIVRAWCKEFRLAQKRYLGDRELLSRLSDRVKADVIDLVRSSGIADDASMLIDPEYADDPYDGVRAQQYMTRAKDALKRLDDAVAERDRLLATSCEEIKWAEVEREIEKVADYWHRSWKKCADELEFGADTRDSTDLRLHSAEFCQDRMCPLCADRMAYKERERMMAAFEHIECEHGDDVTYLFLTLTMPNVKDDELEEALKAIHVGFNDLTHESWWKDAVLGWYRSDEITHTRNAQMIRDGRVWHPHMHVILAVPASYFSDGKYMEQDKIRRAWHRHMIMWGDAEQVDIRRIHDKQSESENKAMTYAARGLKDGLAETIKYTCKTSDYLVRNRDERRRRVEVLHEAMLGTKMHTSGGIIRAALKAIEEQFSDEDDLIHTEALSEEDEGVRAPWLVTSEWMPRLGAYVVTGRVPNVDDDDGISDMPSDEECVHRVQLDLFGDSPGDALGVAV